MEKIRNNLQDTGIGKNFLIRVPIAQGAVPHISRWDYMK